jgi:hypothetical protein
MSEAGADALVMGFALWVCHRTLIHDFDRLYEDAPHRRVALGLWWGLAAVCAGALADALLRLAAALR